MNPTILAADAPIAHPLGPPTVTTTFINVDMALQQPTRITRTISDLTLMRFIADRVFASGGGVTGGAVVYDEAVENELFALRDVQRISPGAEFPLVTWERRVPKVAEVEKWGGKIFITDEARDRNDASVFSNGIRRLSNTIVRKLNQRAIEVLEASIAASGQTMVGHDWDAVVTGGASQTPANAWPAADFAAAQFSAEQDELGITYNLWLLNPAQWLALTTVYGPDLNAVLGAFNLSVYVSNRVPAGIAYAVAEKQVGQMRVEQPLRTATWREEQTERNWVQSGVRPLMFVDNPYAVLKVTGL